MVSHVDRRLGGEDPGRGVVFPGSQDADLPIQQRGHPRHRIVVEDRGEGSGIGAFRRAEIDENEVLEGRGNRVVLLVDHVAGRFAARVVTDLPGRRLDLL